MYSAVVVALSYLIDPDTPKNDGTFRPLDGHRQAGHGGVGQSRRAGDAGDQPLRAGDHRGDHQGAGAGLPGARDGRLGPPLPHRDPGQGPARRTDGDPAGSPFIWHFFQARPGGGASPAGDGWPGAGEWQAAGGIKFGSLEVTEVRFPLFFRRTSSAPIRAAPGKYRGGPGGVVEMVVETAEPAVGNTAGDGVRYGACGILGGADGAAAPLHAPFATAAAARDQDQGSRPRDPPRRRLVLESGGGGGWGDPRERDPAALAATSRTGSYARRSRIRPSQATGSPASSPRACGQKREGLAMYRIGIDVGGTFTDLVAVDDFGATTLAKVPSTPAGPVARRPRRARSCWPSALGLDRAALLARDRAHRARHDGRDQRAARAQGRHGSGC